MMKRGRSWSGRERHCAYLNLGMDEEGTLPRFANISALSGIDFPEDGRALCLTDWDHDGDLDFWISNRTAPQLRFLRNDLASEHHFVALKLHSRKGNRDAIGARVGGGVGVVAVAGTGAHPVAIGVAVGLFVDEPVAVVILAIALLGKARRDEGIGVVAVAVGALGVAVSIVVDLIGGQDAVAVGVDPVVPGLVHVRREIRVGVITVISTAGF